MTGAKHVVAVIIPAYNAAATLPRALSALADQDCDEPHEVIVVDDGSTDETLRLAHEAGVRAIQMSSPAGPAAARNVGAASSSAPILAFTDADCTPSPSWLRKGIDEIRNGADLVTGRILPERPAGAFDRTLRVETKTALFESANLFVTRSAFEAAGGFSKPAFVPARVPHFGEDVVFGWSAVRTGAEHVFAPEVVVRHAVFARGARGYIGERLRLRLFPPLVKEIPELRRTMPCGVFLSARTRRTAFAIAGAIAAGTRRSPLPLLAALPYIHAEIALPWRDSGGLARYNAVKVLADGVGAAALAWGSLRHASLVL